MTTYVLGAGASVHAGFPLCGALWSGMATWVIETQVVDSEFRNTIDVVATLHGPVRDVESLFTDLDLGAGAFRALTGDERGRLGGSIRSCIRSYFCDIFKKSCKPHLYTELAGRIAKGDVVVTFNYDVSLECELVRAGKFRVRNGYGFQTDWDEANSDVTVLKPHGSINWIGLLYGGATGRFTHDNVASLGKQPFVENFDSLLGDYPPMVLDKSFPRTGVHTDSSTTLILPTHEKSFSVSTSCGDEWPAFYKLLWSQAVEYLRSSSRIVIIGYSMPAVDRRARAVLLWNANKRAQIELCCAGSNENIGIDFEDHGFWRVRAVGTFEDFFALPAR